MDSAFYLLCPRYNWPLTPSASMAIWLWEILPFLDGTFFTFFAGSREWSLSQFILQGDNLTAVSSQTPSEKSLILLSAHIAFRKLKINGAWNLSVTINIYNKCEAPLYNIQC